MKTEHVFKFKILKGNVSKAKKLMPSDFMFETFSQNLRQLAVSSSKPDKYDTFIESGFQSFTEAMIVYFGNIIGISDYLGSNSVTHKYKAHGLGKRGNCVATVFCAYNGKEYLTDGNSQVTEYFAQSTYIEGFSLSSPTKIFNIFTDAKDFHENTKKNFVDADRTQVYGIDEIKTLVDGNVKFWTDYMESLEDAKNEITPSQEVFELDVYQKEVVKDLLEASSGKYQVIWPTGTGKNEIMMEHSIEAIYKILATNSRPKILFVAPRIMLNKQGINKIVKRLKQYNIMDCTIVNFSSGDYDNDNLLRNIPDMDEVVSTTNILELNKAINDAAGPVFVFSTYHSVNKIIDAAIKFEMINCDEAHNIVKGRSIPVENRESVLLDNVLQLTPMIVFYTATQAFSDDPIHDIKDGKGMNNPELFGEVISRKTPKFMIDAGKIVRPMMYHITITKAILGKHVDINTASDEEIKNNAGLNAYIIWEAFKDAEKNNERDSINSSENAIKMLVRCSGGQSYSDAIKSDTFRYYQNLNPDVAIYAISSDRGIYRNGVEYKANSNNINMFMEELSSKKTNEKAIILHIAMVGEGWDIPGVNAILPFGEMTDITSSQHLGRGMRLHKNDRERLNKGEIVPDDCYRGKFFKPFCYLIMPKYVGHSDITRSGIERMVEQIQSNMDYWPFEVSQEEQYGDGKMITVSPPRIEKKHGVPQDMEHDWGIRLSIEERRKQEVIRKEIDTKTNDKYLAKKMLLQKLLD